MSMTVKPAEPSDTGPLSLLALSDRLSARTRKLVGAWFIGQTAYRIVHKVVGRVRAEYTYSVAVRGSDSIYGDVHSWLLDTMPAERQRAVTVLSRRRDEAQPIEIGHPPLREAPELRLFYDGSRVQTVTIAGHRVEVGVERPEWSRGGDSEERRWLREMERIIFTCHSVQARDAVLDFLRTVAAAQTVRRPVVYAADRWGDGWRRQADLPRRPLPTVVLAARQKERLVEDIARFLSQEHLYARLGIPWHRGYLLHGPPGTGKTSIARALADHFDLDVHYLALTAVKDDTILNGLFRSVDPRSMLIIEDVDIVHSARSPENGDGGATLQGLLNALDGFATPHGLILIMTSNNRSVLDPRLVRAGRVDLDEEIGALTDPQLSGLLEAFLGIEWSSLAGPLERDDLTPAQVVEAMKRHLDDPAAAWRAVMRVAAPSALGVCGGRD